MTGNGEWGVDVRDIEMTRKNAGGEATFHLKVSRSLRLQAGAGGIDRLPVMGPSGAGKSTFLNLLDPVNMQQAEVLKGPSGSIYGAGNGGVVVDIDEISVAQKEAGAGRRGDRHGIVLRIVGGVRVDRVVVADLQAVDRRAGPVGFELGVAVDEQRVAVIDHEAVDLRGIERVGIADGLDGLVGEAGGIEPVGVDAGTGDGRVVGRRAGTVGHGLVCGKARDEGETGDGERETAHIPVDRHFALLRIDMGLALARDGGRAQR